MSKPPELISSPEVARMINRSPRTVHRLVENGELTPVAKLPGPNGAFVFTREQAEELVERFATEAAS